MAIGTFECPLCGFDKPHTHDASTIRWFEEAKNNPRYDVDHQRRHERRLAELQHQIGQLHEEFEKNPRAYVSTHPTINTYESTFIIPWLLDRLDRVEAELKQWREAHDASAPDGEVAEPH